MIHAVTIAFGAVLFSTAFVTNILAFLLTEVWPLPIKVKPFNCYGCLAFWLTLVVGTGVTLCFQSFYIGFEAKTVLVYGGVACSMLLGFCNFIYIKTKYKII